MKNVSLAVFKEKTRAGLRNTLTQLVQSKCEVNALVYCPALCSSSCGFIVPQPALAVAALLAALEGSAQPPAQGVSHFTLQRWLNNAHQRAVSGARGMQEGKDYCWPHRSYGCPWGLAAPQPGQRLLQQVQFIHGC